MSTDSYPEATADQIRQLLEMQDLLASYQRPKRRSQTPSPTTTSLLSKSRTSSPRAPKPPVESDDTFFTNARAVKPQGTPLEFETPLHLLHTLINAGAFELKPHQWQSEELLRLGGNLDPYDLGSRQRPDREHPLLYCLSAGNSSGKDQFIISLFAVWFALKGLKNRCIITSSSFEQVKNQTEPGILAIIEACNLCFGRCFRSVEFHHVCLLTGSEVKLFATNDAKNAEGYHPWAGGEMAIIINEAKSVSEDIFDALTRCEGYSFWIEVSSPAGKSGRFYRHAKHAVEYPAPLELGKFYIRYVSQLECPHISRAHIARVTTGADRMPDWWIQSHVYGRFCDVDDSAIVPNNALTDLLENPPKERGDDIGIGLDTAAGVDECSLYVRKGNKVIHRFHFRQRDTTETADIINTQLLPWRTTAYKFNADDGHVGHAITDMLVKMGWRINRRHNQSPAYNKRRFLNLGIQMWWKLRSLVLRREIIIDDDPKLHEQVTSRRLDGIESVQGKLKLESKPDHKRRTGESPDRADAVILCFFSYDSPYFIDEAPTSKTPEPRFSSIQDLASRYAWEQFEPVRNKHHGLRRFTQQDKRI